MYIYFKNVFLKLIKNNYFILYLVLNVHYIMRNIQLHNLCLLHVTKMKNFLSKSHFYED
jgi:hypothetical protein